MPDWASEQLAVRRGSRLCVTQKGDRFHLKRLELIERPTGVPGGVIVDRFAGNAVKRVLSINTDLSLLTPAHLRYMLARVGQFRHDPLGPFRTMGGRVGILARRELFGQLGKADKKALREYRNGICSQQLEDGSWERSAVRTGFGVIRLLGTGLTVRNRSIRRGADWLLACTEPMGRPGLWMFSEELTDQFNRSRRAKPDDRVAYRFRRGSSAELRAFIDNADVYGLCNSFCGPKTMYSTGVALEALLRCGLAGEPRVLRTLHTLQRVPWCEGHLGGTPSVPVPRSPDPFDFDRLTFGPHDYSFLVLRSLKRLGLLDALLPR